MRYYIAEKVKNFLILVYADYTKTAGAALRLRSVTAAGGLADCWQNVAACRSRPLCGSLCVLWCALVEKKAVFSVSCTTVAKLTKQRALYAREIFRAAAVALAAGPDPVPISGAALLRFQREASAGSAHRVRLRSAAPLHRAACADQLAELCRILGGLLFPGRSVAGAPFRKNPLCV